MKRKIRVLIAKPGLDGHDRGARMLARTLRDSGMEVIFVQFVRPEEIVQTAIQEAVDFIGLSMLSGAHNILLPRTMELLKEKGASEIKVIAGGTIPKDDIPMLEKAGILKVFPQNVNIDSVVDFLKKQVENN